MMILGWNRGWNTTALLSLAFSITACFFLPAIVPAIVFMLLAVRSARITSNKRGIGVAMLALAPILMLVLIMIVLIAWFRVPRLIATTRANQESRALKAVQDFRTALGEYQRQNGAFPISAQPLFDKGFLDKNYADGMISGYHLFYLPSKKAEPGATQVHSFVVLAQPGSFTLGRRFFSLNETGEIVIRKSEEAGNEVEQKLPAPQGWGGAQKDSKDSP